MLVKFIEYGFYFFIFILPWQTRLIWRDVFLNGYVWEYGRFSLYGSEIVLMVLLLAYGIWLVKTRPLQKISLAGMARGIKTRPAQIYWLAVGLVFLAGLSVVSALDFQLAYVSWIQLLSAVALFSAILIFNFDLKKISWAWVSAAVLQSLFAIWQFFAQSTPANKWLGLAFHEPTLGGSIILETTSERWLRAYGSFPHPNILAGFLLIGLLLALYLSFDALKASKRLVLSFSIALFSAALVFSFSRSAWIAAVFVLAALGIWLWRHGNAAWRKTFAFQLIVIFLVVTALGSVLFEPMITRILGQQPLEVNSIELRLTFTEQAFTLIKNNFLTGTGIGNYTLGVHQQINSSWPGYYYQPVHNLYLLVLAELGIFGALALAWFLLSGIYFWFKSQASLEKNILGAMFAAVLIISLFDHYFWTLYSGVLMFWIAAALNLKLLKKEPTELK